MVPDSCSYNAASSSCLFLWYSSLGARRVRFPKGTEFGGFHSLGGDAGTDSHYTIIQGPSAPGSPARALVASNLYGAVPLIYHLNPIDMGNEPYQRSGNVYTITHLDLRGRVEHAYARSDVSTLCGANGSLYSYKDRYWIGVVLLKKNLSYDVDWSADAVTELTQAAPASVTSGDAVSWEMGVSALGYPTFKLNETEDTNPHAVLHPQWNVRPRPLLQHRDSFYQTDGYLPTADSPYMLIARQWVTVNPPFGQPTYEHYSTTTTTKWGPRRSASKAFRFSIPMDLKVKCFESGTADILTNALYLVIIRDLSGHIRPPMTNGTADLTNYSLPNYVGQINGGSDQYDPRWCGTSTSWTAGSRISVSAKLRFVR